ncbi:hypothetical protein KIPE111705_46720 [Kibdelosporangium persicum]|uniref:hypothetical protein n=1 Tax=Kibdelosporangium persicum TaxID=2698649 RepID=UPI001567AEC1|nr:hypothetical protein [Kibdelosporangium persicum]
MNTVDIATITATAEDWWECACGNDPTFAGFALTDETGRDFDDSPGQWPGRYYLCRSCGLVIDWATVDLAARTVRVVGHIPTPHN